MILNRIKQITIHFVTCIFIKPKTKFENVNSMYLLTIRLRRQQRMRWSDGSPTQWTWVWENSRRQWRTGKPGILQYMGSQIVRHDSATEQQIWKWTELEHSSCTPNLVVKYLTRAPFPAFKLSQHQGLFKWVSSSHQMAKVLELQLQHQSFQCTFRVDFL